ncbi:MAG: aminopeptidase P family protein, partial [Deltaproteobacteria bacterium]
MNEAARRIELLRKLMRRKRLEAWVVPSADPHNSEYVAPRWQRRAFITGFDGSAGTAVIGADWAGLWTDSRYFLQAERQLAGSGIVLHRLGVKDVPDWPEYLAGRLAAGCRVGLNPEVVTERQWKKLAEQFAKKKIKLVPSADLVDAVWPDRPEPPEEPVISHPLKWAGESTRSKLERLRK